MTFRFALVIAAIFLFYSNSNGANAGPEDKLNAVRQQASRVGRVLGAASGCKDISAARIKAMTDRVTEAIMSSARNRDEMTSILELFDAAVADGPRNAGAQANCGNTDKELADLERVASLVQQQPQQARAGAPSTVTVVRGVTDREVRFGIAAPLSGTARELGRQMKLGIEAAFNVVNEAGGVHGRQLKLIAADDGYEPTRTIEAMQQLTEKDQVLGFVGNVGTPTAAVAVPYALERRMLFFGAFTGAGLLRREPPDRYVFNYRASYVEETDAVVHYLVKLRRLKPEQIAVFAQQDAYGDAGMAGVQKAMRAIRGGDGGVILRLNYKRNTVDVDDAVNTLKRQLPGSIKAIVMVATYRSAAKFIEKTRDAFPGMIYTNVSFVGSTSLVEELMLLGPRFATGVIVTQVVPAVDGYSSLVLDYKNALNKYFPGEAPDYVSLEGFIAASVLIEGLKRTGPQLDSERLVEALENIKDFDMGLGAPISFGKGEHQGSHRVWGTQIDPNGKYQAIELQ